MLLAHVSLSTKSSNAVKNKVSKHTYHHCFVS